MGKKAKEIKYYRLYFIKGKAFIEESNVKEIENLNKTQLKMVGENYIEYYWITFHLNGMDEYKIAMFHKDFDHATGNLHVLPGAIQIWKRDKGKDLKLRMVRLRMEIVKLSLKSKRSQDKYLWKMVGFQCQ